MNLKPVPQRINPRQIRMDLNTQARKEISEETVREYAEAMENGATFPPCSVFFDVDEQEYILADGFHRLLAHLRARPNDPIAIDQYLGNASDALWFAICANKSHGLKRTNEDKRNAVKLALLHPNGADKSDRGIAEHVGVHHQTVINIRRELESTGEIRQSAYRTGRDGRMYNIANIGKVGESPLSCGDCSHYKRNSCLLDGENYPNDKPACEEFEEQRAPISDRDEGRDVIRKSDPSGKEVAHRASRRHKSEYVNVPLDKLNTDRAAVEIRMFLGENYLASLAQSALKILKDD